MKKITKIVKLSDVRGLLYGRISKTFMKKFNRNLEP